MDGLGRLTVSIPSVRFSFCDSRHFLIALFYQLVLIGQSVSRRLEVVGKVEREVAPFVSLPLHLLLASLVPIFPFCPSPPSTGTLLTAPIREVAARRLTESHRLRAFGLFHRGSIRAGMPFTFLARRAVPCSLSPVDLSDAPQGQRNVFPQSDPDPLLFALSTTKEKGLTYRS